MKKLAGKVNQSLYVQAVLGALSLLVLYLSSLYSYLLFHTFAEIFSIVVASCIFVVAWNSRRLSENNYLHFIGVAYLFVAGIGLFHTLAYKGMNIFAGYTANLPTQFWLAERYMESISLLIAPFFIMRRVHYGILISAYSFVSILVIASIFSGIFPTAWVDGSGLTPFKVTSEYIISSFFLLSLIPLFLKREYFDKTVRKYIVWSIFMSAASELMFTLYSNVYDTANMLGHYLTIVSFVLIYEAIVVTGITKPFTLLFRSLKQSEETLQKERDFISAVIDTAGALVVVLDREGRIVRFNHAAEEITGYTFQEVAGKRFWNLFLVPEERKEVENIFSRIVVGNPPIRHENHWLTRDGSTRLIAWSNKALYDGKGDVEYVIKTGIDITERNLLQKELEYLAVTDPLTKAFNRAKFEEIAGRELERARRYKLPLSLAVLDIDHFKRINDSFGHVVGDYVLKVIADIMRNAIRETDYLVRWGGEEFIIATPETGLEKARALAERIRAEIERYYFDDALKVTVSIGVTQFSMDDTEDSLVARADNALYRAKGNGRNRVEVAIPEGAYTG